MLTKDGYRYEISSKEVRIWLEVQDLNQPPVLLQDINPNTGQAFVSDEDATTWAENWITEATISNNTPVEESLPTSPVTE